MANHFPVLNLPVVLVLLLTATQDLPASDVRRLLKENCYDCHTGKDAKGGLDLLALELKMTKPLVREQWIQVHDRVKAGEMPPKSVGMEVADRKRLLHELHGAIAKADRQEIAAQGRGPLRRLTREEFEQNLRDVLHLPKLDIRDRLPEDRTALGFNKTAAVLDMSRVQLRSYLDAADAALRQAVVNGPKPPTTKYRAISRQLFTSTSTFGEREAMFFAKDGKAIGRTEIDKMKQDAAVELALFRSAHWPYYGYPLGFVAKLPGEYRVRFSARAVVQIKGFQLRPASRPVPMTFRARKPSGPDVSGDVRATGGIMDIQPKAKVYETTIRLLPRETFEYSLLGLPVPLARNVNGGPPTYRYPPFPKQGQPGVAFQWLEVEGPLTPGKWPPESHLALFGKLGLEVQSAKPMDDARRLFRRFAKRAAREPVAQDSLNRYEDLIQARLKRGASLKEAMLAGYKAFLSSGHMLYLREPSDPANRASRQFAVASRLSHFLTNSRPDNRLMTLARESRLLDEKVLRGETNRLIGGAGFKRFVDSFTDYWLSLRHMKRDEPDARLYPEYRFDDYLLESMAAETRRFFTAMIRDNLPASTVVAADFVYANDRLAEHYGLRPLTGSALRKVKLPQGSPYGGLLTQAAILKVTSHGTSTSPVIRGAWIMDRLLGRPPPPPPASVPAVEPDIRGAKTIRELLAKHARSASCAACHAKFDPVGLALENFDILGRWRTHYRGLEKGRRVTGIDRAGHDYSYTVTDRVDASGRLLDGRSFKDIHGLKKLLLSEQRQLARNLLHQFALYATGAPIRFSERQEIESILNSCQPTGYRVRDLLHGLVQSAIFTGRSDRE